MSYVWLPVDVNLAGNHKTTRLVRRLGLANPATAIGHLVALWSWALVHAPDGNLSHLDAEDIAAVAGWTEDADVFVQALVDACWIDRDGDDMELHDWEEHQGSSFRKRLYEADKKRKQRAGKGTGGGQVGDTEGTRSDDLTGPDLTGHKRGGGDGDKPVENHRVEEMLTSLPLWKGGKDKAIAVLSLYADLPPVTIETTARNLHSYVVANPGKYKDTTRTLINWLNREREKLSKTTLELQQQNLPPPKSTLVRPEMVALYAGMVGEGVRLEELLESCVSDEERTALKAACKEEAA